MKLLEVFTGKLIFKLRAEGAKDYLRKGGAFQKLQLMQRLCGGKNLVYLKKIKEGFVAEQ